MASYFKINFNEPGKNLGSAPSKQKIKRIFSKRLGISPVLLVGFVAGMIVGGVFYVTAFYLPLDRQIKYGKSQLTKLTTEYNVKSNFRYEKKQKAREALKTIEELKEKQEESFRWAERMKVLKRTLVKDLWLSSLEIVEIKQPVADKDKKNSAPGTKDKENSTQNKGKNKEEQELAKEFRVTIRGTTYTNPAKKPLKKIRNFMDNLDDEPYWGDYFSIKDWNVSTKEDITNFEVILESKKIGT